MRPQLHFVMGVLQQDDAVTTTDTSEVDVVCSNQGAICELLYEWTDEELFAEATSFIIGVPVKIMLIAALALIANKALRKAVDRLTERLGTATAEHGEAVVTDRSVERAEERAATIGSLLRSMSTAVVYGAALIMMLEAIGLGVISVIAGAGVLSLAIGFGAQSLVEDLLRGVFMLAEDQFSVDDRIDVGHVNGYVERVTLRTVVIRDSQGTLWHVPNSEIARVANEAQMRSRATVEIAVPNTADLDAAMAVLHGAAEDVADDPAWHDVVQEPPQVSGIQELGDDAVNIRVIVWVDAGERRRFERQLRLKLKEALDAAEIEMPNRQIDVWLRDHSSAA